MSPGRSSQPEGLFRLLMHGYAPTMGTVPETTQVETNPVRVTSEPMQQILLGDGAAVGVLSTYTVLPDTALYSLAAPIEFCCVDCCDSCEATLVAIREQWLMCPACYAILEPSETGMVSQSTAA